MSTIIIDTRRGGHAEPILDEGSEAYGRVDEVFLLVRCTSGAQPRVRRAQAARFSREMGNRVDWPTPVVKHRSSTSGSSVYELPAGFYEVTLYPEREVRYLHVVTTGYGSGRRSEVFSFVDRTWAEQGVVAAERGRAVEHDRLQSVAVIDEVHYADQLNDESLPPSFTPTKFRRPVNPPMKSTRIKDRFERVLDPLEEWDEKLATWVEGQPFEEMLDLQMDVVAEEKAADRKAAHAARTLAEAKRPLTEADLDNILESVLKDS